MKAFLCFAVVLGLACSSAHAYPPFNPKAALDWCVRTVISPVPVSKRIYVLGPDKTKEAYGLNSGIAYHDLETRLAVEYTNGITLAELFRSLPKYQGDLFVAVWRVSSGPTSKNEDKPLLTSSVPEASSSNLVLLPDDMVEISRPSSGLQF